MGIATSLMEQLERIAAAERAVRIVEVEVVCGVMQQVVPEALQLAFEAVTAGTLAEGAALAIKEEAMAARCRVCGRTYAPRIDDYLCPECGQADAELTAGQDIILKSVVCETDGEARPA
jgi:hydrogenase nickel incorporation protein HypA/HybF